MPDVNELPELIPLKLAAKLSHYSKQGFRMRMLRGGDMPGVVRIGPRKTFIPRDQFVPWLARQMALRPALKAA